VPRCLQSGAVRDRLPTGASFAVMSGADKTTPLRRALAPAMARKSLLVALVVGSLLNLINQGDALVHGGDINWLKVGLTYMVPFCVATYGAYCAMRG